MRIERDYLTALLWGFAEATLFFIVPDVWLTLMALRGTGRAIIGSLYAALGALISGCVMYLWGQMSPDTALAVMDMIPAVSQSLIRRVQGELSSMGLLALFVGPFSGAPYKLYAVLSGAMGVPLPLFALISIPARLARFILLSMAAGTISRRVPLDSRQKSLITLLLWTLFYIPFFALMPD